MKYSCILKFHQLFRMIYWMAGAFYIGCDWMPLCELKLKDFVGYWVRSAKGSE
jgi:uncharacterized membrane protein